MDLLIGDILTKLDIAYILICNVFTYLIITAIPRNLSTGWKRVISTITAVLVGWVCVSRFGHEHEAIFTSFFLQFLMYDYVLRALFKKIDSGEIDKKSGSAAADTEAETEPKNPGV